MKKKFFSADDCASASHPRHGRPFHRPVPEEFRSACFLRTPRNPAVTSPGTGIDIREARMNVDFSSSSYHSVRIRSMNSFTRAALARRIGLRNDDFSDALTVFLMRLRSSIPPVPQLFVHRLNNENASRDNRAGSQPRPVAQGLTSMHAYSKESQLSQLTPCRKQGQCLLLSQFAAPPIQARSHHSSNSLRTSSAHTERVPLPPRRKESGPHSRR